MSRAFPTSLLPFFLSFVGLAVYTLFPCLRPILMKNDSQYFHSFGNRHWVAQQCGNIDEITFSHCDEDKTKQNNIFCRNIYSIYVSCGALKRMRRNVFIFNLTERLLFAVMCACVCWFIYYRILSRYFNL